MAAKVLRFSRSNNTPIGSIAQSMLSESQFQSLNGPSWILADGRSVAGSAYATTLGQNTVPDLRGQFLRGRADYASRNFATTDVNVATNNITIANHGINRTGFKVRLTTTTTLPAPLALNTTYFVIVIDSNTIRLATTLANAIAGTAIDITTVGTGTHTLSQWEDPENTSRVRGSESGSPGNTLGARQENDVQPHTHTFTISAVADSVGVQITSGNALVSPSTSIPSNVNAGTETRPQNVLINFFIKINP